MKLFTVIISFFMSTFLFAQNSQASASEMLKGKHQAYIGTAQTLFQFEKVSNGKITGFYTKNGKQQKIKGSYKAKPMSFGYEYKIMLAEPGTSKNDGVFKISMEITSKYENIQGRWNSYDSKLKAKVHK